MSSKTAATALFFLAFLTLLIAFHAPYLKLPFFWDELGQFVPSALDIFQVGAWIPVSTLPNVHPPGMMAYLAMVWKVFGYSILATRLAMLVVASFGLLFSFLLAIRLARGTEGAPAFSAVIFLAISPLFYTQAMMAQLDMPAMTLTAIAILLFLEEKCAACALACTALVLVKETGISTPIVLAAWLWLRDRRLREALYFLAPPIALGIWLVALHHVTGSWVGNPEFGRYNVSSSLQPMHVLATLLRRVYFLFGANGLFLGSIAIYTGRRVLRGREWNIALLVAGTQILLVTLLGGAALDRYLLPVMPILYAAMAVASSVYSVKWRWASQTAMAALLLLGLIWNPPYPFPLEDNLAMADFVSLQRDAASFLEDHAPSQRIASAWPFTDAIERPEFGYVNQPLRTEHLEDFTPAGLAGLDRRAVLVVFSQVWSGPLMKFGLVRDYLRQYWNYHPQTTPEQIRASGLVPVVRWTRRGQWIEIYIPKPRD